MFLDCVFPIVRSTGAPVLPRLSEIRHTCFPCAVCSGAAHYTLQVNLLHHQLPSPCNERGSGFHAALDGGRATVRYNLQLDGRRPFLAGETRTKE